MDEPHDDPSWVGLFEDRYGIGSQARLIEQLRQPCVTFARIALDFGVTRECVRQWHLRLLPGAPSGHERQRQCRQLQRRRQLLQDALFVAFYRRVRSEMPTTRLTLIPSRDGFRKRTVRLGNYVVALKKATRGAASPSTAVAHTLVGPAGEADFVYFELDSTTFLFLPRHELASRATVFQDAVDSPHQPYKNTFAALNVAPIVPAVAGVPAAIAGLGRRSRARSHPSCS